MELHFGAQVQRDDGQRLGELLALIHDPGTRDVLFLAVQHSAFDNREVLVPVDVVDWTDDQTVQITLTQEQFDGLQDYISARNVAPPPDRDFADADDEEEMGPGTETPPVGAATGIESIAFTPLVEEQVHIPTGDAVLDRHTGVYATDGHLGNLRAVVTDDSTRKIQALIVREGTIFTHDVLVPVRWVQSTRSGTVVLTVDKATAESANSQ